jgi:hypothetical protein
MWSVIIASEWQADVGSPYQCQPDSHENEVCSDLSTDCQHLLWLIHLLLVFILVWYVNNGI